MGLVALNIEAWAATLSIPAFDAGRYSNAGDHDPDNTNYFRWIRPRCLQSRPQSGGNASRQCLGFANNRYSRSGAVERNRLQLQQHPRAEFGDAFSVGSNGSIFPPLTEPG